MVPKGVEFELHITCEEGSDDVLLQRYLPLEDTFRGKKTDKGTLIDYFLGPWDEGWAWLQDRTLEELKK